jgi:actin-like ATPase involved in cell morphogenesis
MGMGMDIGIDLMEQPRCSFMSREGVVLREPTVVANHSKTARFSLT